MHSPKSATMLPATARFPTPNKPLLAHAVMSFQLRCRGNFRSNFTFGLGESWMLLFSLLRYNFIYFRVISIGFS